MENVVFPLHISLIMSNLLSWYDVKRFRSVSKAIKKSFRIWNKRWNFNIFLNNLDVGMYIDAMDPYKIWYKAKILSIQKLENKESIYLHFSGWGDKWNIKYKNIEILNRKIAPLYRYTYNWKYYIAVGKKIEFLEKQEKSEIERLWHVGTITKINKELSTIEIKPDNTDLIKQFTINIESDDICDMFTHVKLNNLASNILQKNIHLCINYHNISVIKEIAYQHSIGKITGDEDELINQALLYNNN